MLLTSHTHFTDVKCVNHRDSGPGGWQRRGRGGSAGPPGQREGARAVVRATARAPWRWKPRCRSWSFRVTVARGRSTVITVRPRAVFGRFPKQRFHDPGL